MQVKRKLEDILSEQRKQHPEIAGNREKRQNTAAKAKATRAANLTAKRTKEQAVYEVQQEVERARESLIWVAIEHYRNLEHNLVDGKRIYPDGAVMTVEEGIEYDDTPSCFAHDPPTPYTEYGLKMPDGKVYHERRCYNY